MSNEKILEEIRRLCDPFSILVIYRKRLYRISCPFRVRVLKDVAGFKAGAEVWVERVAITPDIRMVYVIKGAGYHFYLFQILLINI